MIFNIYLFCLAIGVIYTVFTTLIHGVVSIADLTADIHFDADSGDLHFDFDNFDFMLPIRPFTIMVFLTVFGGSGIILSRFLFEPITIPIAIVLAYLIAYLLYKTVYLSLVKAQTTAKSVNDAIGAKAIVLERIPPSGIGRISYKVDGNILSGAAKELQSHTGGFPKGTEVFIHDIKENIYYVTDYPYIFKSKLKN